MKTESLLERHAKGIKGVLECFDRVIVFGTYQAIGWPAALAGYLHGAKVGLVEFAQEHAKAWRLQIATHVRRQAKAEGLKVEQVRAGVSKEALVEQVLEKRGRQPGVVCVLGAMERCTRFAVRPDPESGWLRLQWASGKCEHFYVYFIDEEFGLCHLRIPTWAPFRLQFYCNGHSWLAQQMKHAGIAFTQADNCFTQIGDLAAAQALVHRFDPKTLHRLLDQTAARWVSVHGQFGQTLSWSIHQAEWSLDVLFKNRDILPTLFQEVARTAAVEVGCADIYHFLGKPWRPTRKAEPASRLQTLVTGTRLKHSLGATSVKMYDKMQSVLRIECTTRDVHTFTHYRKVAPRGNPGGPSVKKWAPMRKTIYSLRPLARAMSACTRRYLAYISQWRDHTRERQDLQAITASRRDDHDRSVRGVNFFREDDLRFLQALQRGEHQIQGVRNRTLQPHLPDWSPAKIGRTLRRFRVLKIIKPVRGTRKYYPTAPGERIIAAGLQITERILLPTLAAA